MRAIAPFTSPSKSPLLLTTETLQDLATGASKRFSACCRGAQVRPRCWRSGRGCSEGGGGIFGTKSKQGPGSRMRLPMAAFHLFVLPTIYVCVVESTVLPACPPAWVCRQNGHTSSSAYDCGSRSPGCFRLQCNASRDFRAVFRIVR